jgi:hypothetical protein
MIGLECLVQRQDTCIHRHSRPPNRSSSLPSSYRVSSIRVRTKTRPSPY